MEYVNNLKRLNRLSHFQLAVLIWLALLTIVIAIIIVNLLQAKALVNATLAHSATDITALADAPDREESTSRSLGVQWQMHSGLAFFPRFSLK